MKLTRHLLMPKIRMIATRPQTFAGRYVESGEIILADDAKQAALLRALHRARDEDPVSVNGYEVASLAAVETKVPAKRAYKRRDMKAIR